MEELLKETQIMVRKLSDISGLHVYPTQTNFMLCSIQQSSASELKLYLIENHQFLIRDSSNFEGLKNCHFRIAAQQPEYNEELARAIETFIKQRHG
jgi:threonine-phosphate decarboxylase